jgi:hypothetical protein
MADVVGLFTLYGLVAAVILLIWFVYAIGRFVWSYLGHPLVKFASPEATCATKE